MEKDGRPFIPDSELIALHENDPVFKINTNGEFLKTLKRLHDGEVFTLEGKDAYTRSELKNVWVSRCYSCNKLAIWVHGILIYPFARSGEEPNEDLSDDIRRDYDEARTVLDVSPRAAAALLRLCIQKLCDEVGVGGKNINEDIAKLVSNGLDKKIQQALDIVRVIGNNAVHPGQIDLRDDRPTAIQLFRLVNLISEKLITEPKHIQEMFDRLPEESRAQIVNRDNLR